MRPWSVPHARGEARGHPFACAHVHSTCLRCIPALSGDALWGGWAVVGWGGHLAIPDLGVGFADLHAAPAWSYLQQQPSYIWHHATMHAYNPSGHTLYAPTLSCTSNRLKAATQRVLHTAVAHSDASTPQDCRPHIPHVPAEAGHAPQQALPQGL